MAKFFIDANIYLNFYNRSRVQLRRLLVSLEDLGPSLFVTRQIAQEVRRNRLQLTCQSLKGHRDKLGLDKIRLPTHLEEADADVASSLNQDIEKAREQIDILRSRLDEYADSVMSSVSTSQDRVSIALEAFFQDALVETDKQFDRAERRWRLGVPPGKASDPIGDQLSWLQLLDAYDGKEPVWIVTRDRDYFQEAQGEKYLNPVLYNDLDKLTKKGSPHVRLFDSLMDALEEFAETDELDDTALPDDDVRDKIRDEESLERIELEKDGSAVSGADFLQMLNNADRKRNPNESILHYLWRKHSDPAQQKAAEDIARLGSELVKRAAPQDED